MLSCGKAAEDSSAVMDDPKEPAHGRLCGRETKIGRCVSKDKIKHNHPAEEEQEFEGTARRGKEESRKSEHSFDLKRKHK